MRGSLEKVQTALQTASSKKVQLKIGAGSKSRGCATGGKYWHIQRGKKRAGCVFINLINKPPFGKHPAIQVFVNKTEQGKGIGRQAFKLATEASGYPIVYAYTAKKNIASLKAATAAGFEKILDKPHLVLRWVRK